MFCNKCGNAIDIKKMSCKRCRTKVVLEGFSKTDLNFKLDEKTESIHIERGATPEASKNKCVPVIICAAACVCVIVVAVLIFFMINNKGDSSDIADAQDGGNKTQTVSKITDGEVLEILDSIPGEVETFDAYLLHIEKVYEVELSEENKAVYKVIFGDGDMVAGLTKEKENGVILAKVALAMCNNDMPWEMTADGMKKVWGLSLHKLNESKAEGDNKYKEALIWAVEELYDEFDSTVIVEIINNSFAEDENGAV